MDWYNAKKLLIIVLLITNTILATTIFYRYSSNRDRSTSNEFIQEVTNRLNERGIEIETDIPKNKISLPSLRVEFESYAKIDLNDRFFNGQGLFEEPNNSFTQISRNNEILSVLNTRRLIYENLDQKISSHSTIKAEQVARKFLLDRNFDTSHMVLVYSNESEYGTELHFAREFEGVVLERSFTNFIIKGDTVVSMDRLWLNILEKSLNVVKLNSAPKALLTLLENPENSGRTITRIDECYYFDPEEQGYIEDITKATEGRAIAAWRIQFSDGDSTEIQSH